MVIIEDAVRAGVDALVPDNPTAMFDEDLFFEISGLNMTTYPNGSTINVTIDAVVTALIVWGGKARYYFDNFMFTSSTTAKKTVSITAPFVYSFDLIPKKSIGDWSNNIFVMLPFWSTLNVFSAMNEVKVRRIYNGVVYDTTHAALSFATLNNVDGYYLGVTAPYYNLARVPCSTDKFFKWIDDDGLWRSWFFSLKETKASSKSDSFNFIKNVDGFLNERTLKIDQKRNSISQIYSSGNEKREILQILNSIKTSSYVYAYINDSFERVNIKSEDTTDFKLMDEFIFTIVRETKAAL